MQELTHSADEQNSFRTVLSISELNREVRSLLESAFPLVWIEGEISNLARPASGHLYFSLKDAGAQVSCAMFRNRSQLLRFRPDNGVQVLARAKISLYEPRGNYQLIIEHMEEAGDGALRRAFEALKQRLDAEGLFDTAHKKPLPTLPRRIGVVTSPSGAAIRDILSVLQRRFPAIPVVIYPVPVQGAGAAEEIADMIRTAAERNECDVLIVGRGGGSLEDLWAFNEEVVARAIHACPLPVVSAVGHEIDFTIADFVADQRAPTPSAAAELLSPDRQEWLQQTARLAARLQQTMQHKLQRAEEKLLWLTKRLQHPGRRLQAIAQRLDEQELRLRNAQQHLFRHRNSQLRELMARLQHHTPIHRIEQMEANRSALQRRLHTAQQHGMEKRHQQLTILVRQLDAVSPLAVLGRGYAIVHTLPEHQIMRASHEAVPGDMVEARLGQGRIVCEIKETHDD